MTVISIDFHRVVDQISRKARSRNGEVLSSNVTSVGRDLSDCGQNRNLVVSVGVEGTSPHVSAFDAVAPGHLFGVVVVAGFLSPRLYAFYVLVGVGADGVLVNVEPAAKIIAYFETLNVPHVPESVSEVADPVDSVYVDGRSGEPGAGKYLPNEGSHSGEVADSIAVGGKGHT